MYRDRYRLMKTVQISAVRFHETSIKFATFSKILNYFFTSIFEITKYSYKNDKIMNIKCKRMIIIMYSRYLKLCYATPLLLHHCIANINCCYIYEPRHAKIWVLHIHVSENKAAYQMCGNRTADHRFCFDTPILQSLYFTQCGHNTTAI